MYDINLDANLNATRVIYLKITNDFQEFFHVTGPLELEMVL